MDVLTYILEFALDLTLTLVICFMLMYILKPYVTRTRYMIIIIAPIIIAGGFVADILKILPEPIYAYGIDDVTVFSIMIIVLASIFGLKQIMVRTRKDAGSDNADINLN